MGKRKVKGNGVHHGTPAVSFTDPEKITPVYLGERTFPVVVLTEEQLRLIHVLVNTMSWIPDRYYQQAMTVKKILDLHFAGDDDHLKSGR